MGDSQNDPLRVDFDRQIKLEFHGSTVTSGAELLADRELDDALNLTGTAATGLRDSRNGRERGSGDLACRSGTYRRSFRGAGSGSARVVEAVRAVPGH